MSRSMSDVNRITSKHKLLYLWSYIACIGIGSGLSMISMISRSVSMIGSGMISMMGMIVCETSTLLALIR